MNCKYCNATCQKAGRQKNGVQKLYCKTCKKYQQQVYSYNSCKREIETIIQELICESVSIRGIARILKVGINTVFRYIRKIANRLTKPCIPLFQQEFEVDELRTYIRRKKNQYWIAYAINRRTGKVVDYIVGKRSKRTLRMLTNTLLYSGVKKIFTDKLSIYKTLIPPNVHITSPYCTNRIERNNLNLRTHIKRLSRKTICFSRSREMLENCIRIYFWRKENSLF